MMVEIAFKVKKNCVFYEKYFLAKQEKQKFHDLAIDFFQKNGLKDNARYCQSKTLILDLNTDQRTKYATQLKKYANSDGMYVFKKVSPMQKEWEREVVEKVNLPIMDDVRFWWIAFIAIGSYILWDRNGEIYGYLKDNSKNIIDLPDYFEKIKMSEYYKVIEEEEKP